MNKIKNFKDLNVWKKGNELVLKIYELTKSFPDGEKYCLTQQMRKAAISIPSNIAEGFSRKTPKEYKQFLYISLGSCSELITQLNISLNLKYIDKEKVTENEGELEYLSKMIMSLIKKIS